MATICIGRKKYGIPRSFLRNYPQLTQKLAGGSQIMLADIEEDVGHTLVHFLYSGSYETIDSALAEETHVEREYRRSLSVYQASRTYDIPELGELAKNYVEHFDEAVPLYEILRATREVFSKLPEDESWLPTYMKRVLDRTSMFHERRLDDILTALGRISRESGENDAFSLSVMAMVVEKLSMRVQRLAENCRKENQRASVFHYVRC